MGAFMPASSDVLFLTFCVTSCSGHALWLLFLSKLTVARFLTDEEVQILKRGIDYFLPPPKERGYVFTSDCLSVCQSVR